MHHHNTAQHCPEGNSTTAMDRWSTSLTEHLRAPCTGGRTCWSPAPSSPSPPCPLALGFTFTGACLWLLRRHSCKRSSTCLELKSWTSPPRPALLTYHFAITYASLSCSFSPGLGFPTTFPHFPAPFLSPLLIKHGLDAIAQSFLLARPPRSLY